MTVLVGGLRVLGANAKQSETGVLTSAESLTNDFFVNLLDMGTEWKATSEKRRDVRGRDRATGEVAGPAAGSTSSSARTPSTRAVAEVYASDDAQFITGLRGRVGQGDEPRSVRRRLISDVQAGRS